MACSGRVWGTSGDLSDVAANNIRLRPGTEAPVVAAVDAEQVVLAPPFASNDTSHAVFWSNSFADVSYESRLSSLPHVPHHARRCTSPPARSLLERSARAPQEQGFLEQAWP